MNKFSTNRNLKFLDLDSRNRDKQDLQIIRASVSLNQMKNK